jgi:demethylmenaquinone methyltransferase/2-methoxy-6-polyprenyl-1,4-benzoquinol methylase
MSLAIQEMFQSVAWRYDLANDVLSFGTHHFWKRLAVKKTDIKAGYHALDLCTGTGDIAFLLAKAAAPNGKITAIDFSSRMLDLAKKKYAQLMAKQRFSKRIAPIDFILGDVCEIPLPDNSVDVVTIGFGIRNVDDPIRCLNEVKRVLKPEGKLVVLEFGQPKLAGFSSVYQFYSKFIMPSIGGFITGNREAYQYLPRTSAQFPAGERFMSLLQQAGLSAQKSISLFAGIAYIYLAQTSTVEEEMLGQHKINEYANA